MTTPISASRTVGILVAAAVAWAATACGGTDAQQPGTDPQPPSTDPHRPGADAQRPGADAQRPGADAQRPGIERLAVLEVDLPTAAVTEESGRARLVAALPAGPERDRLAAIDLSDRLLVVLGYDACSMTDPRLQWRGPDHLTSVLDDTGMNCFVPIPAIGVFAVERDQLPDRVTLGGEQRLDSDLVIWQRS